MDIASSYNFRRVTESLTTSGGVRADGLKTLAAQGYATVVNLLPESSEYAVPGERDIVEKQGIEYVYIPVDFKQPTAADFALFAAALDRVLQSKVHIHCAANYRVSAFYALYQVTRGRWTQVQATEFVHDIWKPADHPGWTEFISDILGTIE